MSSYIVNRELRGSLRHMILQLNHAVKRDLAFGSALTYEGWSVKSTVTVLEEGDFTEEGVVSTGGGAFQLEHR